MIIEVFVGIALLWILNQLLPIRLKLEADGVEADDEEEEAEEEETPPPDKPSRIGFAF